MFTKDIAEFLEEKGFGKISENIFIGNMPLKAGVVDNLIAVFDSPSYSTRSRELNSVEFNCQIRVRNIDSNTAYNICNNIFNLISNLEKSITVPSGKRFIVRPINPPYMIDIDKSNRFIYILNISCISERY